MTEFDYDGASLPELLELLDSEDTSRRADAACAIGDRLRTKELLELDGAVREKLAERVDDPVPMVKLEAAIALAEAQDRRATALLLDAMRFRQFRLDAIRSLGTLGDPAALDPLRAVMGKILMPWADKLQAAAALCALGDADGARYLAERLTSRRLAERAAAVHFLGESRHPDALDTLAQILGDAEHPLRDTAARALGLLGDPRGRVPLEAALENASDSALREDIERSLAQLRLVTG
ncbi:MAG: HEAT repeat domain-containing protein [Myxococcota bacterium]